MEIETPKVTGERLKQARLDADLQLGTAAGLLGISSQHLCRIETNKQRCPVDIFLAMAQHYNVKDVFALAENGENFLATV